MCKNDHSDFCKELSNILKIDTDQLNNQFTFDDSTVDSLSVLMILTEIEEMYSIDISAYDIFKSKNLAGLLELIEERSN